MKTVSVNSWGMEHEVGNKSIEHASSADDMKKIIIISILGAIAVGLIFAVTFFSMFIRQLEAILN